MRKHKTFFMVMLCLGFAISTTGCTKCIKLKNIPTTPPTQQITHNNVVFKAAILPSGNPADISVKDYCPSGDGINEVRIGWSETNAGAAEYATINFPPDAFGDGPPEVYVTCCHYKSCELTAYDKNGVLVATVTHPGPQGVSKALKLAGGKISRIDVIGAEIGIVEVCYDP